MADENSKETSLAPALRVSQLDAAELDNDVLLMVKSQLAAVIKYHQTNWMVRYEPEIDAFLKFIIWKFSVEAHDATVGQQVLNLKYLNERATTTQWMSRRQKVLYALLLIWCPWVKERSNDALELFGMTSFKDKINKYMYWMETTLKVAVLINFLVFLKKGSYQSWIERFLGIRSVFPNKQGIRQVSFQYMTRELMWHGFSEVLFFILPLINFQRIKNFLSRNLFRRTTQISRSEERLISCAVCGGWPVNPQEIGCPHVFCYFCIKSNYKCDPRYTCPLCSQGIPDEDCIKQLVLKISDT
ncbi:hypothetical protein ScPMuIL_008315 [Solemya velum]